MNLVVDYVESLLYQTSSLPSLEESDMLGVVSGNGGVSIDAVIYLLPPSEFPQTPSTNKIDIMVRPEHFQRH